MLQALHFDPEFLHRAVDVEFDVSRPRKYPASVSAKPIGSGRDIDQRVEVFLKRHDSTSLAQFGFIPVAFSELVAGFLDAVAAVIVIIAVWIIKAMIDDGHLGPPFGRQSFLNDTRKRNGRKIIRFVEFVTDNFALLFDPLVDLEFAVRCQMQFAGTGLLEIVGFRSLLLLH